ncbi:MAG: hypothetical protein AAGG51_01420 [Cyanobacteria bacterium P01_G01_bin.54]
MLFSLVGAITLIACGPSKVEECTQILNLIEASRQQQPLGTQTREMMLQRATLNIQLAEQLAALPVKHSKLQEYRNILVAGFQKQAAAERAHADFANPDGTVSIRVGDTVREQTWQKVQSQQRQAANQTQLGYGQVVSYCSI